MHYWIDEEECLGCGSCVNACPSKAMDLVGGRAKIFNDKCTDCGTCFDECNQGAVQERK